MNVEELFKQHHNEVKALVSSEVGSLRAEMEKIGKDVDSVTNKMAGMIVAGGAPGGGNSNGEAMKILAEFARDPRKAPVGFDEFVAARMDVSSPRAAMTVGSSPDGGYTVVPDIESTILSTAHDVSPMRSLANVVTVSTSEYEQVVDPMEAETSWVGETQTRSETDAGKLFKVKIPVNEMQAMPKASQSLLDDSAVDIAGWLTAKIGTGFALREGRAFVAGDGVLKPKGFLAVPMTAEEDYDATGAMVRGFGKIQYCPTGSSTPSDVQLADTLVTMAASLRAPYRPRARWLMSRAAYSKARTLKDSQNRYLLSFTNGNLAEAGPELLCGFPISLDETMPAAGANATPFALGDWKAGYCIVDRVGIRILRDPFSAKPYILFYATKRVGGGVMDSSAIKVAKYAAS